VQQAVADAPRPRVLALEWLDPVFVAGHWVPQLIEYAGGIDLLGFSGERSEVFTWEQCKAIEPEVVVVMPCGYDADRAQEEAYTYGDELEELGAGRVVAVDASGLFSRPSHRLVDGLETLAHVLHPDLVPEPPSAPLEVAL
jgi:iron complex transport system substrate-binding protein